MSQPVDTLPEHGLLFPYSPIDEAMFIRKFFVSAFDKMQLNKVTRGHVKKSPTVVGSHVLAVVRAEGKDGNFGNALAKLPMMGIEHTASSPGTIPLGVNETKRYEVDAGFIAMLAATPDDEKMFSDESLDVLKSVYAQRKAASSPLFVFANSVIERAEIQTSLWSADYEVTRKLKKIQKNLMIELYRAIKSYGVQPDAYQMTPSLYNMEYGDLLYGVDCTIPILFQNINYIVDVDVKEIKAVDIGIYNSQANVFTNSTLLFQAVGSNTGLEFSDKVRTVNADGSKQEA
jgi:hypothetical protein